MTQVIYIKKPEVVIEFKDDQENVVETFIFDKSEGAHDRLQKVINGFLKEIAIAETKGDNYGYADLKKAFRPLINKMLGDGAFDRLYKLANAYDILIYYFVQICVAIQQDIGGGLNAMEELLSKYGNE